MKAKKQLSQPFIATCVMLRPSNILFFRPPLESSLFFLIFQTINGDLLIANSPLTAEAGSDRGLSKSRLTDTDFSSKRPRRLVL